MSYFVLFPLLLLVSVALTVTSPFSACLIDLCVAWINPGTLSAVLTTRCAGLSEVLIPLPSCVLDSSSALQSSSLSLGSSKSPFQLNQFSVSEMLSGALSSSLSAGWWLILVIRRTFNTWVRPPGRSFPDKAGGKGDLSDNWNTAAPSCWKSDQDALMSSTVSEMYPTAVICLFWAQHSFCIARRFWLCCHSSKKSWTSAILCHCLTSVSFFNSKSFSVSAVSNAAKSPVNHPLLAQAKCLTATFSQSIAPVVLDCLQPIMSRPREKLASTPTQCGIMEDMSRATLDRSSYFEYVSSCLYHQSVISSDQNVLLISLGSKWYSLTCELTCPQFFGDSGGEFK